MDLWLAELDADNEWQAELNAELDAYHNRVPLVCITGWTHGMEAITRHVEIETGNRIPEQGDARAGERHPALQVLDYIHTIDQCASDSLRREVLG